MSDTDVIVVGAGLAGLVAARELTRRGRSVVLLDQEGPQSLGGQAFWSLGGLFMVDTPEQRRMGVHDSLDLATQDWLGSAAFDRPEDHWPRRWAEQYLQFAAGEMRPWLRQLGVRWFPIVGWAERGAGIAGGHGNTVPRFHVTWGTGPGVLAPFVRAAESAAESGRLTICFRHRVDEITVHGGTVTGVAGTILRDDDSERGRATNRQPAGEFSFSAQAVVVTSGGIGGDHDLVRASWPADRLGQAPAEMISGVPAHVDGRMLGITATAGGSLVNTDRMWHYVEGIRNVDPIWANHGIRILPGPSSLWIDATGRRLPAPLFPGFDTLATLTHLRGTGHDYSWFVLTQSIIEKEFALSGSEQNPDLTGKDIRLLMRRLRPGAPGPVEAFKRHGEDFVVAAGLAELVDGMNALTGDGLIEYDPLRQLIEARDREVANDFGKDAQLTAIRGARHYRGDRLLRVAAPHRLLDPRHGPLIAVRLHVLTRKTLGGIETDLSARVLRPGGRPVPGLYAAGEASGFGGGGMHGYNALEGTFLGGCLFSGRTTGRAVADQLS